MASFYNNFIFEEIEGEENSNRECRGGLCLSKTLAKSNLTDPVSQRFKDLVVPIGLILENRSIDLHNRFMNMNEPFLPHVPESMFEKFFVSMNGTIEKGSHNRSRKSKKGVH